MRCFENNVLWPPRDQYGFHKPGELPLAGALLCELQEIEARHLSHPVAFPWFQFATVTELLQMAALAHPFYRGGEWFRGDADARGELLQRFESFLLAAWRQARPREAEEEHEPEEKDQDASPAKEKVPGMGDFLAARSKKRGPAAAEKRGLGAAKKAPGEELRVQVGAWLSLAPEEAEDAWKWWATAGARRFPAMLHGVRRLLLFRSGNAGLERVFSAVGRLVGSKGSRLRKSIKLRRVMKLRINGPALGLAGYKDEDEAPATEPESEDD